MSELESYLKQRLHAFNPYHADRGMTYEDGLLLIVANGYRRMTGDAECLAFLRGYLEGHIAPDGTIRHYGPTEFNIDNILAGNVLFDMADLTGDSRYGRAADALRDQLERHPRTRSGNFWHKRCYPDQIWLDGLYMGQPFRTMYALRHDEQDVLDDVVRQVKTVRRLLWDDARKLYVHACDEERRMPVTYAENPEPGLPAMMSHLEPMRKAGWFFRYVDRVVFDDVVLAGAEGPATTLIDVADASGVPTR
ncbi:MAG: glycoside hydrolase family 88 protein [Candidatus Izemoplasmatales bacterium]